MSTKIRGNIRGLSTSQLRAIHRLGRRKLDPEEFISLDLARELLEASELAGRIVGLLISREGRIEEVFVGDRRILYIPDLGRYRLGAGRLRRLRLVFANLSKNAPKIPNDILTDLEKLRFDGVIGVSRSKSGISYGFASLNPNFEKDGVGAFENYFEKLSDFNKDFSEFIASLERELSGGGGSKQSAALRKITKSAGFNGAVLVGVYSISQVEVEDRIDEMVELARTAGISILKTIIQRRIPDPRTLLGKGKIEELSLECLRLGAELIIFDGELKPSQWRSITKATDRKVIDRGMLILDIFARRALSREAKMQVELAQLKYNLPRLTEMDSGLSRLSGGIGGRGPGETKLEINRRRARDRISMLEKQLEKIEARRLLQRKLRSESLVPQLAIIGYTNAGKSTLFNRLANDGVLVEDKLFATLSPTARKVRIFGELGGVRRSVDLVVSDTVGFIRDLPDELRFAFKATLEELGEADLLIHLVDVSDSDYESKIAAVETILQELGFLDIPRIIVANKLDLLGKEALTAFKEQNDLIIISAKSGFGIDQLKGFLLQQFASY
ncbi:MAG TPA: GTPase HflX [Oligoflexia bacterium]|nr:GTPase HflX [Oligoflexia bacterium]HMP27005.1 GTPase HflX [Oligoflexia bacterium]